MRPSKVGIAAVLAVTLFAVTADNVQAKSRFQKAIDQARFCADLKDAYDENMSYYNANPKKRLQWKNTADNIKTLAEGNNCDWATGRRGGATGLDNGVYQDDPQIAPLVEAPRLPRNENTGVESVFD